jgi:hypothetical protein
MAITSFLASTDDNWIEFVGSGPGTARTTSTGTTVGTVSTTTIPNHGFRRAGSTYTNRRYYCWFDTSSLPDSAIITKVLITLWRISGSQTVGDQTPHRVMKGTFPTGALSTSNYGDMDLAVGNMYLNAQSGIYNGSSYSTPFIATGSSGTNYVGANLDPAKFNSAINKQGISKFVIVAARDIDTANGNPSDGEDGTRTFSSSNDITANRPLLTVEWTLPNPLANYITN